jgi:hypothetical protein
MRKSLGHLTVGTTLGVGGLLVSAPAIAQAQTNYVSTAVDNLTQGNVYVTPGVNVANLDALDALDGSVAYVALPAEAEGVMSNAALANQIYTEALAEGKTFNAVVVTVGANDALPVYPGGPAGSQVAELINGANAGSASAGIGAVAPQIAEQAQNTTVTSTATAPDVPTQPAGVLVGVGGGVLSLAILAAVGLAAASHKRRRGTMLKHPVTLNHLPQELKKSGEGLRAVVRDLREKDQAPLAKEVDGLIGDVDQLFVRLARRGDEQQARLAEVEYIPIFKKLSQALGDDYYLNIVKSPQFWDSPEERIQEVWDAVKATRSDVVKNIKLVNASGDLEFKSALDSLSRSLNTTHVEDMYDSSSEKFKK